MDFAMNQAVKVLRDGRSWHGGSHAWSLPTQAADGTWEPGAWTPPVTPHLCSTGYHLTRDPAQWWGDGDVVAYVAEYDGAVDDRCDEKFAVEQCRLLRPLEAVELAAAGIYLSGEHGAVTNARIIGGTAHLRHVADSKVRWVTGSARIDRVDGSARIDRVTGSARIDWVDGSARIDRVTGSARIDRVDGSARIDRVTGSARIDWVDGSARIDRVTGSARIDRVTGSARIDWVTGSARIDRVTGSARIDRVTGSARIDWVDGSARIDWVDGSARIDRVTGSARIDWVDGSARIDWVDGSARIDWVDGSARIDRVDGSARIDRVTGSATAHASGDAIVVVCHASPTVTVRGRASVLDYRPARPVHHIADDGQVLTLAPDGTASQSPVAQGGA